MDERSQQVNLMGMCLGKRRTPCFGLGEGICRSVATFDSDLEETASIMWTGTASDQPLLDLVLDVRTTPLHELYHNLSKWQKNAVAAIAMLSLL